MEVGEERRICTYHYTVTTRPRSFSDCRCYSCDRTSLYQQRREHLWYQFTLRPPAAFSWTDVLSFQGVTVGTWQLIVTKHHHWEQLGCRGRVLWRTEKEMITSVRVGLGTANDVCTALSLFTKDQDYVTWQIPAIWITQLLSEVLWFSHLFSLSSL